MISIELLRYVTYKGKNGFIDVGAIVKIKNKVIAMDIDQFYELERMCYIKCFDIPDDLDDYPDFSIDNVGKVHIFMPNSRMKEKYPYENWHVDCFPESLIRYAYELYIEENDSINKNEEFELLLSYSKVKETENELKQIIKSLKRKYTDEFMKSILPPEIFRKYVSGAGTVSFRKVKRDDVTNIHVYFIEDDVVI